MFCRTEHLREISETYDRYYVLDCDTTRILQTYSLRFLRRFIQEQIPELKETGSDTAGRWLLFFYKISRRRCVYCWKEDVEECWEAVEETREAVRKYLESQK